MSRRATSYCTIEAFFHSPESQLWPNVWLRVIQTALSVVKEKATGESGTLTGSRPRESPQPQKLRVRGVAGGGGGKKWVRRGESLPATVCTEMGGALVPRTRIKG